jgi:tRNA dimethylallyltransferase
VLALFGPTAVGKSALAHAAALALGGEVVVADPFQRYRGLEIAADAPRPAARAQIPYHCVGDLDLTEGSSAGSYARLAHAAIDDALGRGRLPVVSGGSGLYLRAALADLAFPAPVSRTQRADAEAAVARDAEAALAELRRLRPEAAGRVDTRNPRRLVRALELARAGVTEPGDALWGDVMRRPTVLVGVVRPREVLDRLIGLRVRREIEEGLVPELEAALDTAGLSREAGQIIGAREVAARRRGELDPAALEGALIVRTRVLARRQLAWLRRMPGAVPLDLGEEPAEAALPRLRELWRRGERD